MRRERRPWCDRHDQRRDTGLELSGVTDAEGIYTIRNITGGTYTLKAVLHGFKESSRPVFRSLPAALSVSTAASRLVR